MIDWSALESRSPQPRFHVEAPDGRKDWPEQGPRGGRQEAFIAAMHRLARA